MRKLAEAYVDDIENIVLVRTTSGTYKTYVSTDDVIRQLRKNRIQTDLERIVAGSLNRLLRFLVK